MKRVLLRTKRGKHEVPSTFVNMEKVNMEMAAHIPLTLRQMRLLLLPSSSHRKLPKA